MIMSTMFALQFNGAEIGKAIVLDVFVPAALFLPAGPASKHAHGYLSSQSTAAATVEGTVQSACAQGGVQFGCAKTRFCNL